MRSQSCDKGWGNIIVAIILIGFGIRYELLLAILGMLVLVTAAIATVLENRTKRDEKSEFRKTYPEHTGQRITVA